jgi:3-hydroxybutyryl-CoA dehydratase
MNYEDFTVGQEYQKTVHVTQDQINAFAQVSGDHNPLHTDPDFARQAIFGRPIAHGMYGLSLISAVLGTDFPGFGTIYMNQEAKFLKPIFIDESVRIRLRVKELQPEKKRMLITTTILKENDEVAIDGEARVQYNPDLFAVGANPA